MGVDLSIVSHFIQSAASAVIEVILRLTGNL
jgi:hypothetical protein